MRRILTLLVSAYWAIFFALIAVAATGEAAGGTPSLIGALRGGGMHLPAGAMLTTLLAFGFALASVLFCWQVLTCLFQPHPGHGDGDELTRIAFGAGIAAVTLLLITSIAFPRIGLATAATMQLATLLLSWIAIRIDLRRGSGGRTSQDEAIRLMRSMASGAAHSSMLVRLSGKRNETTGKAS